MKCQLLTTHQSLSPPIKLERDAVRIPIIFIKDPKPPLFIVSYHKNKPEISTEHANHIVMRIEWKHLLWSRKRLLLARDIAESLCTAILGTPLPPLASELKVKAIGYDGYDCLNKYLPRLKKTIKGVSSADTSLICYQSIDKPLSDKICFILLSETLAISLLS